jgi:sugar phosphate isomerase/epimerase
MRNENESLLAANYYLAPPGYGVGKFMQEAKSSGAAGVGLTVAALEAEGASNLANLAKDHGLFVSSLNSAGYFLFDSEVERERQDTLNRRLIEAAATIQARRLVVIAGGMFGSGRTLEDARACVVESLARLDSAAADAGIRLALEPIHPMDLTNKGCINSVRHALSIVRSLPSTDVVIDIFHTYWDPDIWQRETLDDPKLALVQVCDWAEVTPDRKPVRELPGHGHMDLKSWLNLLKQSRYRGPVEFEMFDQHRNGRAVPAVLAEALRVFETVLA